MATPAHLPPAFPSQLLGFFGDGTGKPAPVEQNLPLLDLPPEIALKIFGFLGAQDLCRLAMTCKTIRVLSKDDPLWRDLALREGVFLCEDDSLWCNLASIDGAWVYLLADLSGAGIENVSYRQAYCLERFGEWQELQVIRHHTPEVRCFAIYGNKVIRGLTDETICIWDLEFPEKASVVFKGHTDSVISLAVHGNKLIGGSKDGTIRIWDLA